MVTRRPSLALGFVLRISAVVALSIFIVAISLQGWKAQPLFPSGHMSDLATQVTAADDLIYKGQIPNIGGVSSLFGRIPPGTAWLLVPGFLMFDDPRLFEVPGSAVLFLLTLAGIVITGRALYDETLGWLAACLYALSPIGLFFASSLWPRGHPFFVIWTLYFCCLAIQRSRPIWFVLASAVYLFGMYVYIEIAPLGIVFVAALTQNRKLVTWWTLPTIAIVAVLIWVPYLRFQSNVDFVDVGRILTANHTIPGEPNWCGEPLMVRTADTAEPVNFRNLNYTDPPRPREVSFLRGLLAYRLPATIRSMQNAKLGNGWGWGNDGWRSPFKVMFTSGLASLLMLGAGLCFLAVFRLSLASKEAQWIRAHCFAVAWGLVLVLLTFTLMRAADAGVDWHGKDILYVLGLIMCFILLGIAIRLVDPQRLSLFMHPARSAHSRTVARLLLLSVLVGQITWSLAVPFEARHFIWLWPLECLCVAFALRACCQCISSRWVQVLLVCPVIAGLAFPAINQPLRDWYRDGWTGHQNPILKLLDHLVAHRKGQGEVSERKSVSLSYDIVADQFNLAASSVDSRYSVGMAYDLYLKYKYSLQQELVCADSYSGESRYMIREDRTGGGERMGLELHPPSRNNGEYVLLNRADRFSLYWRPW
jgi:hypothetical protein